MSSKKIISAIEEAASPIFWAWDGHLPLVDLAGLQHDERLWSGCPVDLIGVGEAIEPTA